MPNCRSCSAAIVFLTQEGDDKLHPIDTQPSASGTFSIYKIPGFRPGSVNAVYNEELKKRQRSYYRVQTGVVLEQLRRQNVPLYTSHKATCRKFKSKQGRW